MGSPYPLTITILGCGTSTGVPVIGCLCPVCTSENEKNKRNRSSLLITTTHGDHIVIDTGPEFRLQMVRERICDLRGVIYTHTHADHSRGFDDLRAFNFKKSKTIPCYVPVEHMQELKESFSYAFRESDYLGSKLLVDLKPITDKPFSIADLEIDSIILPHGHTTVRAYRIGQFVYATDFKEFPLDVIKKWKGTIDIMIASGVHFTELPTHSSVQDTVKLFEVLGVRRGIITHLSHCVDYVKNASLLPSNYEFAYDGMKLQIDK